MSGANGFPLITTLTGNELVKLASPGAVDNFTSVQAIADFADSGTGGSGSFSTLTTSGLATLATATVQGVLTASATASFGGVQVMAGATITASVSGFNLTMSNTATALVVSLTQTTATGTVTLPAAPVNKQIARLSFNEPITALTVTASTASTLIKFAPSTASTQSAGSLSWIYQTSDTTWYTF